MDFIVAVNYFCTIIDFQWINSPRILLRSPHAILQELDCYDESIYRRATVPHTFEMPQ